MTWLSSVGWRRNHDARICSSLPSRSAMMGCLISCQRMNLACQMPRLCSLWGAGPTSDDRALVRGEPAGAAADAAVCTRNSPAAGRGVATVDRGVRPAPSASRAERPRVRSGRSATACLIWRSSSSSGESSRPSRKARARRSCAAYWARVTAAAHGARQRSISPRKHLGK